MLARYAMTASEVSQMFPGMQTLNEEEFVALQAANFYADAEDEDDL